MEMATTREVELLRRQLEELNADAVRTMGQSVTRPRPEDMRVGKPEPYMPGKDSDDWDFTFN